MKEERKKKKLRIKRFSHCVQFIFIICSIALMIVLVRMGILPDSWLIIIGGVLLVLNIFFGFISFSKRVGKANKLIQILLCSLLSIVMAVCSIGIPIYQSRIESLVNPVVTSGELNLNVYVLADSSYEEIRDLEGKTLAIQTTLDLENQEIALENIALELDPYSVETVEYEDIYSVVEALYNGEVEAILLNEVYEDVIVSEYEDFMEDTKIIYTVTQQLTAEDVEDKYEGDITENVFAVLIGGIDSWSDSIEDSSRTDVNILMVVNPRSKQVLMITIPRDSYVAIDGDSNKMDKLTHSSVYGVDAWMSAVESVLDIDIDFYFRVNFTSVVDVVEALGGLDIENPYAFTTIAHKVEIDGIIYKRTYSFAEGSLHLDGYETLAYVRERKNLTNGDIDRNAHAAIVLSALVDELTSTSVLSSIDGLLDAMDGLFATNMTTSTIYELVKMQLKDNASWDLVTYGLSGTTGMASSYATGGTQLSMVFLDDEELAEANELIGQMLNNETIVLSEEE